jgi:hypothetical protein
VNGAGLFKSWQACLHCAVIVKPAKQKRQRQQQQQQQVSGEFLFVVSCLWWRLWTTWQPVVLLSTGQVAPVLLRTALPALEFGTQCMQHAAHQQHATAAHEASSSSSSVRSTLLVSAGVLLHQSVLAALMEMMYDPKVTVSQDPACKADYGNMHDALVEAAALHQVVAACSLMRQQLYDDAQPSAEQQQGQQRGSDAAAGDSSSSSSRRCAAASIAAFHEPLLPLLPGGQAFVEAVLTVTGDAASCARPNTQLQLLYTSLVSALLLCIISTRRSCLLAVGRRLPPGPVPVGVYLQLMLERQLLAAALFQQWQQLQSQQQQQPKAEDRLRNHSMLKGQLKKGNSMLLELTKLTQGGASCLTQLLSGPDAMLPRALAVPLHVEGFWEGAVQQDVSSSPGEQLYALQAVLEATGAGAPGEQRGSKPLARTLLSLSLEHPVLHQMHTGTSRLLQEQNLKRQGLRGSDWFACQRTLSTHPLLHCVVCPCVCTQGPTLTAYHAQLSLTAACAAATLRQQTCRQLLSCWQTLSVA